jgi:AAA domain
MDNDTA